MSKKISEIRERWGEYAFDIEYPSGYTFTMFFNSLRNAQTVRRCLQVDDSVKNATTPVDFVEVVRCRDCKHFQPCFVLNADGERRPYTEEEIRKGKMVTGDVGINCGSRCERFGYWDENKIPVWFSENDFCSYGERRTEE